jgi:hypothetical protein
VPKGLWALVNFVIPFAARFRKRPVVCGHTKVTMSALAKVKMSCFSNVADAECGWSRRDSLAENTACVAWLLRAVLYRTRLCRRRGDLQLSSLMLYACEGVPAGTLLFSGTARGSASLYGPPWSGPIQARVGHEQCLAIPVSREHLWPRGAGHFSFG